MNTEINNMDNKPDFSLKNAIFPHINKEGWRFGIIALVLAFILPSMLSSLFLCLHLPSLAVWFSSSFFFFLFVAYGVFLFFRDPERFPPANEPDAILSPADGRVCLVRKVPMPKQIADNDNPVWCVSVFMSVMNVHVNRAPFDAEVVKKVYVPGKFFNASLDKASEDNERCIYMMQIPDGRRFGVVQIAGLIAKRIVPFVDVGSKLSRTERFGLIRFGSRLDVYLPEGVEPAVSPGQTMVAGESVLGRLGKA